MPLPPFPLYCLFLPSSPLPPHRLPPSHVSTYTQILKTITIILSPSSLIYWWHEFFSSFSSLCQAGHLSIQIWIRRPLQASLTLIFQVGRSPLGAWYVNVITNNLTSNITFDSHAHNFIYKQHDTCYWFISCLPLWYRSTDLWCRFSELEERLVSCQESTPPLLLGKALIFTFSTMERWMSRCRTWLPGRWRNHWWMVPKKFIYPCSLTRLLRSWIIIISWGRLICYFC